MQIQKVLRLSGITLPSAPEQALILHLEDPRISTDEVAASTIALQPEAFKALGLDVGSGREQILITLQGALRPGILPWDPPSLKVSAFDETEHVGDGYWYRFVVQLVSADKNGDCWRPWRKTTRPLPFYELNIALTGGPFEEARKSVERYYTVSIERVTERTDIRHAA